MQKDFVSHVIEATKDFESPASFWRWSAYAAIAATMRHNVYVPYGREKLYPNIYVLLLADSAISRKDAGPKLVSEILRELKNTKVIQGRASWQGICDELYHDVGQLRGGAAIIIAPELSAFFVDDPSLIPNITEGYAYEKEFDYILRGGKIKVKDRCITMLAASNETLLRKVYNEDALHGGLLRRTLVVKADEKRPPNSLMYSDEKLTQENNKLLVSLISNVAKLKGEMIKTPEAIQEYDSWYRDLYSKYDTIQDRTGFMYGLHTLVFKVAMIIAASEYDMKIEKRHIEEAIVQVTSLRGNYEMYAISAGRAPHANIGVLILSYIWICSGHRARRKEILARYWNEITSEDLDKLIATWEAAGLVKSTAINGEVGYELTEDCKKSFMNGKGK